MDRRPCVCGGGGGVRACVRARARVNYVCGVVCPWYVCACSREKSQRQIAIIPPTPQNGFYATVRDALEIICFIRDKDITKRGNIIVWISPLLYRIVTRNGMHILYRSQANCELDTVIIIDILLK